MQATENLIYTLKIYDSNGEIRVLNEELITLQVLGQTECPNSSFYLTNKIELFFIRNKTFYFKYQNKVEIGRGSFAVVYKATKDGITHAIKSVNRQKLGRKLSDNLVKFFKGFNEQSIS